jgi:two-component system, cell cycle sensor histidine kinase and response regulator CckA
MPMFRGKTDPLSVLLEGIADHAVFLLDADGNVVQWTSSAEKVFGYTASDIEGQHSSKLYPEADADKERVTSELQMAAAHGRFEDITWRLRRDRTKFWADSVICPLRDKRSQLQGFSVIIRDITERKKAEESLRQKEEELTQARKMEAMGRFAGGIAHDFNNFITGIVGLADEVRLSLGERDPRRADLEEIIKTADQARILTRELLAFGRRQTSTPQVTDLNTVLNEKRRILSRLVGADIQFDLQLEAGVGRILIDRTQLDQMLINLIMNARDAMPNGGSIRLETHRLSKPAKADSTATGPQIELVITDTGTGMDPEIMRHLFEPFFTTKAQGKGTGLGLATVYGIVKQNHGDIVVQSRPGHGTTFRIQFPEIDAPAEVPQPAPMQAPTPGYETILVAEDTDIVRRVVTENLRKTGYRVLSATSGQEALELAKSFTGPIHLVLTDVIMPGMNGPQMVDQLRTLHPESSILYMSAYAEDLVQKRGTLGEAAFIEKPFTAASLLHKIRQVLDDRRIPEARKRS